MTTMTVTDWVDAALEAAMEVATSALACDVVERATAPGSALVAPFGAYVPLLATDSRLQIGVIADRTACEAMARALLGMAPDEAFGADCDVRDAIGEIANMVAGGVKTRMNGRVPGLQMGLPLCVSGHIEQLGGAEYADADLLFGDVRMAVMVLRSSGGARQSLRSARQ
jgi:CheY-specific phosphatase CheX